MFLRWNEAYYREHEEIRVIWKFNDFVENIEDIDEQWLQIIEISFNEIVFGQTIFKSWTQWHLVILL